MRYLPLSFTRGPLLTMLARAACEDPNRRTICIYCGGRVPLRPEAAAKVVRCPNCWRRQEVSAGSPEAPTRLSSAALDALRRTKKWARSWPRG